MLILTTFSLLIPAFSLVYNPQPLPLLLLLVHNALLPCVSTSQASVCVLAPLHFRRRGTRPVSYYALFECVAASEPTSWLSMHLHILFHLNTLWDLSCGSGLFPF